MKKFTFLMAMVLGFALNAMAINPYAYGVSITPNADNTVMTLKFSLNAPATAVNGVLYKDGVKLGSMPLTAELPLVPAGTYDNISIPVATALGANPEPGVYTFGVEVVGAAHDFQTSAVEGKTYSGRIHATVDAYPTSANFGNIYVTSRDGNERGMFFITPAYEYESTTVERFGKGNDDWGSCQRGAVAPNGEMWYSSWSDGNSGIHRHDHSAATPAITQFFLGTRASSGLFTNEGAETGCSTPGIGFYVDGANTKLYMVAEDFTGGSKQGSLAIYNVGQADGSIVTSWGVAPSAHYNVITDAAGTNFAVAATPYGAWICQHRALGSNNAGARSLQFITNAGAQTFLSTDTELINGSLGAGIVTNAAADKLWMVNGQGNLMQFTVAWADGTPTLTKDTTYTTPFSAASQLTFDFAGNIVASVDNGGSYVSGSTKMGVTVISLPAAEATVVETPVVGFDYTVQAPAPTGTTYTKVTEAPADWSGEYVIAVPSGENVVLFTGIDGADICDTVALVGGKVVGEDFVTVTVAKMADGVGYSMKVNGGDNDGKYLSSGTSAPTYSNGLKFITTPTRVDFALNADGTVAMTQTIGNDAPAASNTVYFIFNGTANNHRYRFYKGTNYQTNNYPTPVLYKKDAAPVTPVDPVEPEIIWSDFLGDGAAGGAYNNTYKYGHTEDQTAISFVNIQHPGFATADGIYLKAPVDIDACSLTGYDVQGAGICVHLSNFTAKVTEFTITCGTNVYTCYVWNENGTDVTTGFEAIQTEKAVKFFRGGQIYIQKGDAVYTISGVRVE